MTILLLEDDFALHSSIKKVLTFDGHDVISFYDGERAYNGLNKVIQLYILDINVPNISGLELLEKIKYINPNARVLIISANIDLESLQQAYKRGCDDYLRKPFYIEELQMKIANLDAKENSEIFLGNTLYYNKKEKVLYKEDAVIVLTKNEHLLLSLFIDNINSVVTKEQIFSCFEYDEIELSDDALRSLIKRLRQKIGKESIVTVVNEGYVLKIFNVSR